MNLRLVLFAALTGVVGVVSACTTVIVGREASATGRVILGHNEDNFGRAYVRHALLPAGEGKASRYWAEVRSHGGKPPVGDLYFNEYGVAVFSNNGGVCSEFEGKKFSLPKEGTASTLTDGGIGERIRCTVAEQARSAREGVVIVTNLVTRYGYSMPGRIFTVADRDEAWMVEVVRGRRFVARRCPDDAVCVFPNCLTVGRIEPGDIVSDNIREKGADFDFAATYQGPRTWRSPYNLHRCLDFYRVTAGVDVGDPGEYPFSVRPTHKVTVKDVQAGLSCHYEGKPWAVVDPRHPKKSAGRTVAICRASTVESTVCAMGETPAETELHVATGRPCETEFVRCLPFAGKLPKDAVTGDEALRRLAEHDLPAIRVSKRYRTPGLIGGMGPAATCDLMMKVIENTVAADDQHHIHMLVDQNTDVPDRTAAILKGGADPLPEMLRSARRLEREGADFLCMSCNTAHYFYDRLAEQVSVPILNMPAESARELKRRGVKRVGLLATDGTIKTGVYHKFLESAGIEVVVPEGRNQATVMSLIYDCVKKGVPAADYPAEAVKATIADLRARGAEAFLMACTELPIAFDRLGYRDGFVDPTRCLARAIVREAGAPLRQDDFVKTGGNQ